MVTKTSPDSKLSPRIQRLKSRFIPKSYRSTIKWHPELGEREDVNSAYRPGIKLCLERPRLYTEAYKASASDPTIIRRAKALANVLENMTVWIQPDELIVGNYASTPNSLTWHPEYAWRWLTKAIKEGYKDLLDDEGKAEVEAIGKYWRGKSVQGKERQYLSKDLLPYWEYNGASLYTHQTESGAPDYDKLFAVGIKGLIKEAEDGLVALESETCMDAREIIERRRFYDAVLITLKATIKWANRYAELAKQQAEAETDTVRKAELLKIAETCSWVPENPPRTLMEAIQFFYFMHLITHIIEAYENGITARVDQIFYPFYKGDVDAGKLNREQTVELFECLWLKCNEMGFLFAPVAGGGAAQGSALQQTMTVGGVTKDGRDAVNELSYIILDSRDDLPLGEPTSAIRIHNGTPREFLLRVVDSVRSRFGTVSLFNDEIVIARLLQIGIPLEDARNYGIEQCMRWSIPGKNLVYRSLDGRLIGPKLLELALNKGIDKFSGKQIGCATPDAATFKTVEDVENAFFAQVGFFADKMARITNIVDVLYEEELPRPFLSATLDGGIAAGKDCRRWYYYPRRGMGYVAPTNVANSIAAIKKVVFDDKKATMAQMVDAVNKNWEGYEDLRKLCIAAPKFGNDDDYVDLIARDIHIKGQKIIASQKNYYGGEFYVEGSSVASYFAYSNLTGATPDGRRDKELFGDGTVSPVTGTDTKGPTAILKSASKCDALNSYNHLLNQKFTPELLAGDHNKDLFVSYLKAWHDLGIHHVQFNITSRETLIDAQIHPEKHSDLVVRVAGYAAYFVDLAKGTQDQIIGRTEHGQMS